jgi:hypothetical protein
VSPHKTTHGGDVSIGGDNPIPVISAQGIENAQGNRMNIGSCGDQPSSFDAAFALCGIEADEVQGDLFEDGQAVGGMSGMRPHLVIGEDQRRRFSTLQCEPMAWDTDVGRLLMQRRCCMLVLPLIDRSDSITAKDFKAGQRSGRCRSSS